MASDHRHLTSGNLTPSILLLLILVTPHHSSAQPPSSSKGRNNDNDNDNNNNSYFPNTNFNPSMAIIIIALISAFFFLGFFSIYIRQCADGRFTPRLSSTAPAAASTAARSRRQRGLDTDLLQTFPTLVYSEVKVLKIGKGSLECAVCLSEFEDDETLRLLPKCSHVFHPDCIDTWLASHVTCPVCRSNLAADSDSDSDDAAVDGDDHPPHQEIGDQVAVDQLQESMTAPVEDREVRIEIDGDEEERKTEMENLERFVNMKRARSRARPAVVVFPRSHSTGHSLVQPGQNLDRFTLRLPEDIRKEIVAAGTLKRATSLVAFREGKGVGRAGRSVRLGQSGRWGSFLSRTLSLKNWGRSRSSRGAEPDQGLRSGSVKEVRFNGVIASGEESESSTAALNRV